MTAPAAPRRIRGARESLVSIVLAFESIIVFLGGLTVYGLRALPAGIEPWWGIVGGAVLAVLMIVTGRVARWTGGVVLGGILQIVLALGAFLVPALLVVALIFGGMYAYATIKGGALDERNARLAASPEDAGPSDTAPRNGE
ncbi:DUF4233 domain-containing protein [Microbacterium aureliae]